MNIFKKDNRKLIYNKGQLVSFFMKRFLIFLLATLALPTAVNAGSYWLVLRVDDEDSGVTLEYIEMKSMD